MRNLPQRDAPSGRECGSPIASHIPALTYLLLNTLTLPFQPLFLMLFQCPTHAYILWERNPILEILSWSKRTPARNVAILKGLHTNKKLVTLCPTPESSRCWDCLLQLPFGQRVMKAFLLLLSTPMMVSSYSLSCSHRPVNKHQSLDTQPWTLCTTMSDSFFILFISSVHPEDAALAADVDCNFQHVELINFQFGQNKRLCCIFFLFLSFLFIYSRGNDGIRHWGVIIPQKWTVTAMNRMQAEVWHCRLQSENSEAEPHWSNEYLE